MEFQIVGGKNKSKAGRKPDGLKNLGNTCFLNCLVQVLRQLNPETKDKIKEFNEELHQNIFDEDDVKNLQKQLLGVDSGSMDAVFSAFVALTNFLNNGEDHGLSDELFGLFEGNRSSAYSQLIPHAWDKDIIDHMESCLKKSELSVGKTGLKSISENVVFTFQGEVLSNASIPHTATIQGVEYRLAGCTEGDMEIHARATVADSHGNFFHCNDLSVTREEECGAYHVLMLMYTRTHTDNNKHQKQGKKQKQEETKVEATPVADKKSQSASRKKKQAAAAATTAVVENTTFLNAVTQVLRQCNDNTKDLIVHLDTKQLNAPDSVAASFAAITDQLGAEVSGKAFVQCSLMGIWKGKLDAHLKSNLKNSDSENVVFTFSSKCNLVQDVPMSLKQGSKLYKLAGVVYSDYAIIAPQNQFMKCAGTGAQTKVNSCVSKEATMVVYTRNTDQETANKEQQKDKKKAEKARKPKVEAAPKAKKVKVEVESEEEPEKVEIQQEESGSIWMYVMVGMGLAGAVAVKYLI